MKVMFIDYEDCVRKKDNPEKADIYFNDFDDFASFLGHQWFSWGGFEEWSGKTREHEKFWLSQLKFKEQSDDLMHWKKAYHDDIP